jgi:alpha-1,3-mannosyltransferase
LKEVFDEYRKKNMKIAHICRQFYPSIGGVEKVMYNLATEQFGNGHDVTIITLNRHLRTNERYQNVYQGDPKGVKVIRIPFFSRKLYPVAPHVLSEINKLDPDILHIHNVDFFVDFLAVTKLFHKKKMVLHTHGGFFHTSRFSTIKRIYFNTITRYTLSKCDAVITVSLHDYKIFKPLCGSSLHQVDNGVEVKKYNYIKKQIIPFSILFVGRIVSNKRVDNLVRTISNLKQDYPACHLHIVGPDWGAVKEIEQLIKTLNCTQHVTIHSAVTEKELMEKYSTAHVFASASEYESFGITALEALATGTICVLQHIPTFHHFITDCKVGYTVDYNQPMETSTAFANVFSMSRNDLDAAERSLKQFSQKFSWKKVNQLVEKIYGF